MRVAKPVELNADDDRRLRILSKRKRVEARRQLRARIVLLAATGLSDKDIAGKLDIDRRVAARGIWLPVLRVLCRTPPGPGVRVRHAMPST